MTKSRRVIKIVNLLVQIVVLIIAPIIAIYASDLASEKVFYPNIYQASAVITSLIIFVYALICIKKIVKGIEGAYPNQVYMNWHFVLLISTLIFNVTALFFYT